MLRDLLIFFVTVIGTKVADYGIERFRRRKRMKQVPAIVSAEQVAAWGWSGEKLLKELIHLDKKLLGDMLNPQREGTVAQWAPVFMSRTEGWALLATWDKRVVGYFSFFALNEDTYRKAGAGALLDSEITIDTTIPLDTPAVYKAYFVLLGALPEFPELVRASLKPFSISLRY